MLYGHEVIGYGEGSGIFSQICQWITKTYLLTALFEDNEQF